MTWWRTSSLSCPCDRQSLPAPYAGSGEGLSPTLDSPYGPPRPGGGRPGSSCTGRTTWSSARTRLSVSIRTPESGSRSLPRPPRSTSNVSPARAGSSSPPSPRPGSATRRCSVGPGLRPLRCSSPVITPSSASSPLLEDAVDSSWSAAPDSSADLSTSKTPSRSRSTIRS